MKALDYIATRLRQLIRRFSGLRAPYIVEVDDNFHYMDESERYTLGRFRTFEAARSAARKLVDDYLKSIYKEGMTVDEMYSHYTGFGEDPHIVHDVEDEDSDAEDESSDFSAWDYARERCRDLCKG